MLLSYGRAFGILEYILVLFLPQNHQLLKMCFTYIIRIIYKRCCQDIRRQFQLELIKLQFYGAVEWTQKILVYTDSQDTYTQWYRMLNYTVEYILQGFAVLVIALHSLQIHLFFYAHHLYGFFFMLHSPLKIVLLVCFDTSGFGRTK